MKSSSSSDLGIWDPPISLETGRQGQGYNHSTDNALLKLCTFGNHGGTLPDFVGNCGAEAAAMLLWNIPIKLFGGLSVRGLIRKVPS